MISKAILPIVGLTTLFSFLGQGSAAAVSMPVTFVGVGFITTLTSSCTTAGFSVNQAYTIVYRPAADGLNDGLILQFQAGAVLLTGQAASLNGKKAFTSIGIADKAVPYNSQGTSNLRIVATANGLNYNITGDIPNLYGDPSCTLTIQAAATRRP